MSTTTKCTCGHLISEHTYSNEKTGCDKCFCKLDLGELIDKYAKEVADRTEQNLKDLIAVEANYDALQSPMPCGHLARYAVNEKEGTQYCAVCNGDALFEAGKKALEYINKMNKFARACIRYAGNSGDTYLADKAREALGENNHE